MDSQQSWSKDGTVRHCQSKEAGILWSHLEETRSSLEKEIMQGTMPGACRQGRPCTAWMDNINTWTGLPVEESVRRIEINGESTSMVWPTLGSRMAKEQNRYFASCNYLHHSILTIAIIIIVKISCHCALTAMVIMSGILKLFLQAPLKFQQFLFLPICITPLIPIV